MLKLEDAIYEAAVLPVRWPQVLAQLSLEADALGGVLFSVSDEGSAWTSSASIFAAMHEFVTSGWAANNSRMSRGLRKGLQLQPRFVGEMDYDESGMIYQDSLYQEFFIPNGMGQSLGTIAPLPHGDMLCFSFERAFDLGPFDERRRAVLDAYRPHLMRAAMLTAHLGMERVRSSVETLSRLGYAAAALDATGRVLTSNELFTAPDAPWTTRAHDRLALHDQKAEELLFAALANINQSTAVGSIPLREPDRPARYVLHILPVRKEAHDIFTRASALIAITSLRSPTGDTGLLQVLFDLTPAEAAVARRLAAGEAVNQIALLTQRSRATVRNQVRSILVKTGCRRQADLVQIITSLVN